MCSKNVRREYAYDTEMIYEHLNIDDLTFNYSDGDKSIAKVHFVNRDQVD